MESNNDNFRDQSDLLLTRAQELFAKNCQLQTVHQCSLMTGGQCPLLISIMHTAVDGSSLLQAKASKK
jgi:hypothetical protein